MEWVYKIAGIISVVCGVALILAWFLLSSTIDPEGRRMFVSHDVAGLAGFGILLICAGGYLALSKPKPGA
jgi:hypothetical protein